MTTSSETHLQENTPRRYRRVLRLLVFAAAALLMFTAALCFYITQPIIGSQSTTNSSSVDPHRLESHVRALSQTLTPRDASYPDNLDHVAEYIRQQFALTHGRITDQPFKLTARHIGTSSSPLAQKHRRG